jgi:hypothetical protein
VTTATPCAALEIEVFRHQVRIVQTVVELNLRGITHEESLIPPRPDGNCLNWVLGHLVCTYNNSLPLLGLETVIDEHLLRRYARGAPPLRNPTEALKLRTLLTAWDRAAERIDVGLMRLTHERLASPAPFSPGNDPDETVRSLLSVLLFHQAYHAGQTGILRRIIGKEGAIP